MFHPKPRNLFLRGRRIHATRKQGSWRQFDDWNGWITWRAAPFTHHVNKHLTNRTEPFSHHPKTLRNCEYTYFLRCLKRSKTRPSGRVLASVWTFLKAWCWLHTGELLESLGLGQWGVCSGKPRKKLEQNRGGPRFWSFPGTPGTPGTRQNPHRAQSRFPLLLLKEVASPVCCTLNCISGGAQG